MIALGCSLKTVLKLRIIVCFESVSGSLKTRKIRAI